MNLIRINKHEYWIKLHLCNVFVKNITRSALVGPRYNVLKQVNIMHLLLIKLIFVSLI